MTSYDPGVRYAIGMDRQVPASQISGLTPIVARHVSFCFRMFQYLQDLRTITPFRIQFNAKRCKKKTWSSALTGKSMFQSFDFFTFCYMYSFESFPAKCQNGRAVCSAPEMAARRSRERAAPRRCIPRAARGGQARRGVGQT